ncbi:myeloid differentiation primary response protein MyD88 [Aphomia sociella]
MDNNHIDLYAVPLKSLGYDFRTLSSCLLNSKKILPADGPDRLSRDWRGLASLINISNEVVESIYGLADKTAKVIELWCQKRDGTATLGKLMEYLQLIDRYDVYDDLQELIRRGRITVPKNNQVALNSNQLAEIDERDRMITHDDRREGVAQHYHAYVLFAEEDWEFVNELLTRMRAEGYKLCTILDLEPGHETQYAPVAQLISERCHRIILVYSPEFLSSPANSFYTDYAQAVGIESKQRNIIPIIYRNCRLPVNLTYYYKLIYRPDGWSPYNFWEKLSLSLRQVQLPRANGMSSSTSTLNITEMTSGSVSDLMLTSSRLLNTTISDTDSTDYVITHPDDTGSISNFSSASKDKKRNGVFHKVRKLFKGKDQKHYD